MGFGLNLGSKLYSLLRVMAEPELGGKGWDGMFAGTAVRLGKELGVATPVCEMFYHGIRLIEDRLFGVI